MSKSLFFSSKIFSGQRTGHWHGVSFLGWTSKCPSSNQSLPYFKCATSSSGKGRTFETFAGYSRNQSLPGLHRVDPYPMSCHPFALLAATNDPESQISKIDEYSVKKTLISSIVVLEECISRANCRSWFDFQPFCIIRGCAQKQGRPDKVFEIEPTRFFKHRNEILSDFTAINFPICNIIAKYKDNFQNTLNEQPFPLKSESFCNGFYFLPLKKRNNKFG